MNRYVTLVLVEDALFAEQSEEEHIQTDTITGKDNLVFRIQGEFAYNAGVKGFVYDGANGGVNPDDTALGTGNNWDSVMDDVKDLAGVAIYSQG